MLKFGTHDYLIVLGILNFLCFLLPYRINFNCFFLYFRINTQIHILIKQGFFQQLCEKTPGQKMIVLTVKLGEINDIEHNKGSKIYPQNQIILDCIMPTIPLKHKCLSIILNGSLFLLSTCVVVVSKKIYTVNLVLVRTVKNNYFSLCTN